LNDKTPEQSLVLAFYHIFDNKVSTYPDLKSWPNNLIDSKYNFLLPYKWSILMGINLKILF